MSKFGAKDSYYRVFSNLVKNEDKAREDYLLIPETQDMDYYNVPQTDELEKTLKDENLFRRFAP